MNRDLHTALAADEPDLERVHWLLDEVKKTAIDLDEAGLGYTVSKTLERGMDTLAARPGDLAAAQSLRDAAATVADLPSCGLLLVIRSLFRVRPLLEKITLVRSD